MEWQTVQTLIRLLFQKQSDLGLHCLLRPICPISIKIDLSYDVPVRQWIKSYHNRKCLRTGQITCQLPCSSHSKLEHKTLNFANTDAATKAKTVH